MKSHVKGFAATTRTAKSLAWFDRNVESHRLAPPIGDEPWETRRGDHWAGSAQLIGSWTGVSAGWLGLFFGFALIWTIDQITGKRSYGK